MSVAPAPLRAGPTGAPDRSGRIPFRIRIGVTGRREISADLTDAISNALDRVQERLIGGRPHDATEVRLAVVSELAEGGDRIVVDGVFEYARQRGQEARLEVVLPMERAQYAEVQGFDKRSRAEFDRMLDDATFTIEPPPATLTRHEERADAYAVAAAKLVARCDVLLALWDGGSAVGKRGGTADTLLAAAAQGKPCVWIPTEGAGQIRDNFEPNSGRQFLAEVAALSGITSGTGEDDERLESAPLASLSQVFALLDEYNREPRPRSAVDDKAGPISRLALGPFGRRVERVFQCDLQEGIERRVTAGTPAWLAAPSARASVLAEHYRTWFKRLSTLVLASATLAAVALAAGVAAGAESAAWGALEFVFLMLTLVAFLVIRRFGFHSRWLSYRVLAERFRSARYISPTGLDFRDQTRLQGIWVEGRSEEWPMRAFEEVWDREPHRARNLDAELEQFKRLLADDWVAGQIAYHELAQHEHDRLKGRLTLTAFGAFGLTIVFALLEAILTGLNVAEPLQRISKALTIVLPVLGASVGAALTINQHQALAERSTGMQADLKLVRADLEAATDTRTLLEATIAAARLIAPESGTWFAALWFLDMEHP